MQTSGFLGSEYALLREGEEGEALQVYRNPNADWAAYDKIKLDPVDETARKRDDGLLDASEAAELKVQPPGASAGGAHSGGRDGVAACVLTLLT